MLTDPIRRSSDDLVVLTKQRPTQTSICIGCGLEIFDRYILRVSPDLEWHAACLRCAQCQLFLDETCTAFIRDGKCYCKNDYIRLFGAKCHKCGVSFVKNDCVMRARHRMYHMDCFRCEHCARRLMPGDEFALRNDQLYCRMDYEQMLQHPAVLIPTAVPPGDGGPPPNATVTPLGAPSLTSISSDTVVAIAHNTSSSSESSTSTSAATVGLTIGGSGGGRTAASSLLSQAKKDKKDKSKTTRVRTVLNEKQLHTLRSCYNANPRPDALMKEQLVEMTGLNPRVIRVWFQNKRCKDKKRQQAMKYMQQQHEKNQALNGVRLQGIGPLMASSPTSHDNVLQPVDIQQMQQSQSLWQPLQPDCDSNTTTAFQQLMHGFGDPSDPSLQPFMQPSATGPTSAADSGFGALDTSHDLDSGAFSPQMAQSDLSSPSCSD